MTEPINRGDWVLTRSGRRFYPLHPCIEDVALEDIAFSLGHQCRWTGHTRWHYSVAQHALTVAQQMGAAASPSLLLAALHHDSAEAYIGDIARPWKRNLAVLRSFGTTSMEDAERDVLHAIFDALDITWPSPREWDDISRVDNLVLRTEREQLLPAEGEPWDHLGQPIAGLVIAPSWPGTAVKDFLDMHKALMARVAA